MMLATRLSYALAQPPRKGVPICQRENHQELVGEDNIIGVSFEHISKHKEDKQAKWCHM
jgi:hypothetical protein